MPASAIATPRSFPRDKVVLSSPSVIAVRNGFRFKPAQTSPREMTAQDRPLAVTEFPDLEQFLAHRRDVGIFGRQRLAERDHHPVRNRRGHFVKNRPPWKKRSSPRAGRARREQPAPPPAARLFRSRAANAAVIRCAKALLPETGKRSRPRESWRPPRASHLSLSRSDGNATHRAQDRMQKAIPVNAFIDDETNRPRRGELKHDGVHPCDVIRQEEKAARGKMFHAGGGHAINEPGEPSQKNEARVRRPRISPWNMIYKEPVVPCNRQFHDRQRIKGQIRARGPRSPCCSGSICLTTSIALFSPRSSRISARPFSRRTIRTRWRRPARSLRRSSSPTCFRRRSWVSWPIAFRGGSSWAYA